MDPAISAVICTYNRVEILQRAMESVSKQSIPDCNYEVIIVDNASTDRTGEIASKFCDERPHFRYFSEPITGLSRARNTGIREARGRIVAFLDDDAIAGIDWLESMLKAFGECGPGVGCIGGKTLPDWEVARPKWLHDVHLQALSIINWSDDPCVVEPPRFVVGANIAYDKALVVQLGGFNEKLGRKGLSLLSGDETELNTRIIAAGRQIYYAPSAAVLHLVSRERLTKAWHLERAKWQGIGDGVQILQQSHNSRLRNFLAVAKDMFRIQMIRFMRRAFLSSKPQVRFLFQTLLWSKINYYRTVLAGDSELKRMLEQ